MNLAGIRRGSIAATGLAALVTTGLLMGSGVAAADASADKSRTTRTDDGWDLTVTKTAETLDRYPNLASTPTTREGFVSLKGIAEYHGAGKHKVDAGDIAFGYQLGCQVDVSSGLQLGLGFSFGPNVGVTVGGTPGVTVGGSAAVIPSMQTTLKPGAITTIVFGTKPLAGQRASIAAEQVEIKVDACAGPVTLRSFATATIKTSAADHAVTVYGDPMTL
ncbi:MULTISPECIES: MspA family porin [unclassified Nocardia]|uniref:MspA family porin n=1 Tax=unclassified Nocardia TaxID=2637762 RepID=UPI001CE46226|nr:MULTISPECIES: MspA family porin [unclassified Nocardia]